VEQFHELFRRHGVHFGKSGDLPQLAPKLIRNDAFRVDFSMLARWMQHREEGRLTVDEMVTILGIAMSGPRTTSVNASNVAPLMVFLSGLGGWSESGLSPRGNNEPQAPDAFRVGVDNGTGGRQDEERKAGDRSRLNGEAQDSVSSGGPMMFAGSGQIENGTGWQEAGTREQENANTDRLKRIRQQLDDLDGRPKVSREVEGQRYKEIVPAESPRAQSFQQSFVVSEISKPEPPDDIFRAYRANLTEALAKQDQGFLAPIRAAVAKLSGESAIPEKRLRLLVAMFGFLVLLPPFVVCLLLYRDAVRIASQSPMGPFVTRERGLDMSEADPRAQRRAKTRGRVAGQPKSGNKVASGVTRSDGEDTVPASGLTVLLEGEPGSVAQDQRAEIPVIEREPRKIHIAPPDAPPMVAAVGPSSLAQMPGNRGGAENWMEILGHMDEIDVSPRTIPMLVTVPAKIHVASAESAPVIAETETKMAAGMPSTIVAMSYPVVMSKADGSPSMGRGMSGVSEEAANVKLAAVSGGGMGSIPRGGSSAKQFNLVHPSVVVSAGLLSSNIVKFQMPAYPKAAKKQRLEGDVLVRVLISEKGKIDRAVALNGPSQLRGAVEKAVRHWRYKPYVQNGQPVQVQTWVTFHFAMQPG